MKKSILWIMAGIALVAAIVILEFACYEGGKARIEKDLVYGIARRTYTKVGPFILMPMKNGATMITFEPKPFTYSGAGDDTKQGVKK